MRQPPDFEDAHHPTYVCRLHKVIYGLKQLPPQWFGTLTSYLHDINFHRSQADSSLYILWQAGSILYLLVYVDDILLSVNNQSTVNRAIQHLYQKFVMKILDISFWVFKLYPQRKD